MNEKSNELILNNLNTPLLSLLKQLKDTIFWVKNKDLTIIAINPTFAHYLNLEESQILGKTDSDLYPQELAINYLLDDKHIIETGESIEGKIELLINRFGAVEWRKITKLPIFDENHNVIGTTGISRAFNNSNEAIPKEYSAFTQIIDYASQQLQSSISVKELANFSRMSESTLNRRFQEYLQISPQQFLSQLRVAKACQLLNESVLHISEIADSCGYESPAAFSRAFKKLKHVSPREYRK